MPTERIERETEREELSDVAGWAQVAESKMRQLADTVTVQVREHPMRTLAIAGAAGFLLASVARPQVLPGLVRSGLGVVAAVALRRVAQNALGSEPTIEER